MNHQRSLRCLGAAPRLVPGSGARIARAQGVAASSVAEEMGRLKVPVSVSGNPRPERLSALRHGLTGAGAHVIVTGGTSATVPLGPLSARLAPGDAIGAALSFGDVTVAATGTTTYVCLRRQGGGLPPSLPVYRPDGDRRQSHTLI